MSSINHSACGFPLLEQFVMVCRCCGAFDSLRREVRVGFWQKKFFPIFGLFPWECVFCRKVKLYTAKATARTEG